RIEAAQGLAEAGFRDGAAQFVARFAAVGREARLWAELAEEAVRRLVDHRVVQGERDGGIVRVHRLVSISAGRARAPPGRAGFPACLRAASTTANSSCIRRAPR